MNLITSPHNPHLKELRRLARKRDRERGGRFVAEGEDLIAAAARARRPALEGYRLAGSGLGGEDFHDVAADALAAVSTLGSGTRVIGVYEQRWEPAVGRRRPSAHCACISMKSTIPATSARSCARRRPSARPA